MEYAVEARLTNPTLRKSAKDGAPGIDIPPGIISNLIHPFTVAKFPNFWWICAQVYKEIIVPDVLK